MDVCACLVVPRCVRFVLFAQAYLNVGDDSSGDEPMHLSGGGGWRVWCVWCVWCVWYVRVGQQRQQHKHQ